MQVEIRLDVKPGDVARNEDDLRDLDLGVEGADPIPGAYQVP